MINSIVVVTFFFDTIGEFSNTQRHMFNKYHKTLAFLSKIKTIWIDRQCFPFSNRESWDTSKVVFKVEWFRKSQECLINAECFLTAPCPILTDCGRPVQVPNPREVAVSPLLEWPTSQFAHEWGVSWDAEFSVPTGAHESVTPCDFSGFSPRKISPMWPPPRPVKTSHERFSCSRLAAEPQRTVSKPLPSPMLSKAHGLVSECLSCSSSAQKVHQEADGGRAGRGHRPRWL